MSGRLRLVVPSVFALVVALSGVVEATRQQSWALLGLFVVIASTIALTLASLRSRVPVTVRTDLAAWLDEASSISGESPESFADRALAAYRSRVDHGRRS